jgi:hypothetical protein
MRRSSRVFATGYFREIAGKPVLLNFNDCSYQDLLSELKKIFSTNYDNYSTDDLIILDSNLNKIADDATTDMIFSKDCAYPEKALFFGNKHKTLVLDHGIGKVVEKDLLPDPHLQLLLSKENSKYLIDSKGNKALSSVHLLETETYRFYKPKRIISSYVLNWYSIENNRSREEEIEEDISLDSQAQLDEYLGRHCFMGLVENSESTRVVTFDDLQSGKRYFALKWTYWWD